MRYKATVTSTLESDDLAYMERMMANAKAFSGNGTTTDKGQISVKFSEIEDSEGPAHTNLGEKNVED